MPNTIPSRQNETDQIRLLRARRFFYACGMRLLWLQVILTVVIPTLGALSLFFWPSLRGGVALSALVIAILDATVFDRLQKALRRKAATLQEDFDCRVLELPWDTFVVGTHVEPEAVHEASDQYLKGREDPELKDWYPPIVGTIPLHLGRIICQRTNLWYDAKLRRKFGNVVLAAVIGLSIAFLVIGLLGEFTLEKLVLTVVAPAAPLLIWGLREHFRQRETADRLDRLRAEAETLWSRAKANQCPEGDCTVLSRQFQNAIFQKRSDSPLIFGWIYKRERKSLESQMNKGATSFIEELSPSLRGGASS